MTTGTTDGQEVPLSGGRSRAGVVRVGDTVRRPLTDRSPFVHRVLVALAEAGVSGVPRLLGIDDEGREILSYQPGDTGHGIELWPDDHLVAVAALTRCVHDALAGTDVAGDAETVCHHDIAPWNVVLGDDDGIGLIDFDDAGPGRRVDDLGYLAWVFLGLESPVIAVSEQARRLRVVVEAYRGGDRLTLEDDMVDAILGQQGRILAFRLDQAATAADAADRAFAAERVEEIRACRRWVERHRDELEAALR